MLIEAGAHPRSIRFNTLMGSPRIYYPPSRESQIMLYLELYLTLWKQVLHYARSATYYLWIPI